MTAYFDFFLPATLVFQTKRITGIGILFVDVVMMDVLVVDFLPFGITGTPEQFFRCRFWFRSGLHVPTLQRGCIRMFVVVLFLFF